MNNRNGGRIQRQRNEEEERADPDQPKTLKRVCRGYSSGTVEALVCPSRAPKGQTPGRPTRPRE